MEWRDIKGFEGYYQVSDTGIVKSLARVITRSNGRINTIKESIINPSACKSKYLKASLSINGKNSKPFVHRLVLEAFSPNPDPVKLNHINHIDENKHNNNLNNLEWISQEDNIRRGQGVHYTITSPDGTVYNVHGLSKFCREHNLDVPRLSRIATGKLSPLSGEARGWNCQYLNGTRSVGEYKTPKKL